MTMLLWHLSIGNFNLMLAKLSDYFFSQLCFSSRLSGLTSKWCNSQKPPEPVYLMNFTRKFWSANKYALKTLRMRINSIFGTARRLYFDYFHISVHSLILDRKHYKIIVFLGVGERSISLSPTRSTVSYLRDYMSN